MLLTELGERHHGADGLHVRLMDGFSPAQVALVLGGLLGQDVALERLTTFDGTAGADHKALGSAFFRLHLRHFAYSIKFAAAGGPTWTLKTTPSLVKAVENSLAHLKNTAAMQRDIQLFFLGASTIII